MKFKSDFLQEIYSRGFLYQSSDIDNLDRALKADSSSSAVGSLFGCSPVTSYVESSAGIEAGGRTGLTAVTVGVLFLLAIFFAPLASMIPAYATSGALIYVAILMLSSMEKLIYMKFFQGLQKAILHREWHIQLKKILLIKLMY